MSKDKPSLINSTYDSLLKSRNGFNINNNEQRLNMLERMHIKQFTELSCNRFEWVGLPDNIDQRYLELELFAMGTAVFLWSTKFERFMVLRGGASGVMDYQDNPTKATFTGNQMISGTEDVRTDDNDANALVIYANYTRIPEIETVYMYASNIADMDMTIQINAKSARLTKIVKASEKKRLSQLNIQRKIMEGEPIIYVNDNFNSEDIAVLDLGVHPDTIVSMQSVRAKLWNEAMTVLGINNANQDKKERMVADEVGGNDDQINVHRAMALKMRRKFANDANEYFGLNISVHFASDDQAIERAKVEAVIAGFAEPDDVENPNAETDSNESEVIDNG